MQTFDIMQNVIQYLISHEAKSTDCTVSPQATIDQCQLDGGAEDWEMISDR